MKGEKMVDALITFSEGQDILASEANQNNQFLLSKLSDNAMQLTTYVEQEITSMQSNIASVQATVQANIDEVSSKVDEFKTDVYTKGFIPDYSKGQAISSGFTAPSNGWVNWNGSQPGDSSSVYLWVNGVEVGYHSYYKYGDSYRCQFLVGKGDSITFSSKTSAKFFPCKGGV